MAFPVGWARKCALVIQNVPVTGDLTNYTVYLSAACLPSEMFDADGSYPALEGGGDIRFSSDVNGATQLACDVSRFHIDNNPANGYADIFVLVPSVSSASDTTFYVWYKKASESQPSVTDTYGKNNAYDSSFAQVYHFDEGGTGTRYNSKAASNDLTPSNYSGDESITGKMGLGDESYGTGSGTPYLTGGDVEFLGSFAFEFWSKLRNFTSYGSLLTKDACHYLSQNNANPPNMRIAVKSDGGFEMWSETSGTHPVDNSWQHWVITRNSGAAENAQFTWYKNGADNTSGSQISWAGDSDSSTGAWKVMSEPHSISYWDGSIDELRFHTSHRSAAYWASNYNNQSSPETFVVEGTPSSATSIPVLYIQRTVQGMS